MSGAAPLPARSAEPSVSGFDGFLGYVVATATRRRFLMTMILRTESIRLARLRTRTWCWGIRIPFSIPLGSSMASENQAFRSLDTSYNHETSTLFFGNNVNDHISVHTIPCSIGHILSAVSLGRGSVSSVKMLMLLGRRLDTVQMFFFFFSLFFFF